MPIRRPSALAAVTAVALTGTLAGCHSAAEISRPGDPQAKYKCVSVNSDQVTVGAPTVVIQDGKLSLSGTVHRNPGVTAPLEGRVSIDLIGPDGLKLDKSLHAPIVPNAVPMDPNAVARYSPTPFGYVPPAGSTIRARYVSRMESYKEGIDDGILDYNGNNGHTGEGVSPSQENGSMPASPSGGGNGTGPNGT